MKKEDEISLSIQNDDLGENNFVITNAFIFDDKEKSYYFKSNQTINTSTHRNRVGKSFYLNAFLEPVK